MGKKKVAAGQAVTPDEVGINAIQARRLAKLAAIPEKGLAGETLASLADKLRWNVNPEWFWFVRVCGQVVKVDPSSGWKYPVPGATINVLDIDCDWLWFFPPEWPWAWCFPLEICGVEKLASTTTDACGNFCVWIPRFDIDWVVEWRRKQICIPELFRRPNLGDLLQNLKGELVRPWPPIAPGPGPDPAELGKFLVTRSDAVTLLSPQAARVLRQTAASRVVGTPTDAFQKALEAPAFAQPVPPPVHPRLRDLRAAARHEDLAMATGLSAEKAERLRFERFYGPFLRCFDVWEPEWLPILEVPDITFQVTQDTDGDGDQEAIYEGAYDVPWGTWPVPNVELDASPVALALPTQTCGPDFPCADSAAIQMVGLMPVDPAYLDPVSGFAIRPNPPSVAPLYPTTSPFCWDLQLYGCVHVGGALYYRILRSFAAGDGLITPAASAFSSPQPMTFSWPMYEFAPTFKKMLQAPVDSDGWYLILSDDWYPVHMLMDWPTGGLGVYKLYLQLGAGTPGSIAELPGAPPPMTLVVDGTTPAVIWTGLAWHYTGDPGWTSISLSDRCYLIQRHKGSDIEVRISYTVSANHFFEVSLAPVGCGVVTGGSPTYRYQDRNDNTHSDSPVFGISGAQPPGCYTWSMVAGSRAFNPSGYDGGLAKDWIYDTMPIYVTPWIAIAVIDV